MSETPEDGKNEPNLELPSLNLGFRRKKKGDKKEAKQETPAAEAPTPPPAPAEPETPAAATAATPPAAPAPATPAPVAVPTAPVASASATPAADHEPPRVLAREPEPTPAKVTTAKAAKAAKPAKAPAETKEFKLPPLNGKVAAVISGVIVGVVGVVLAYIFGQGCEAIRGNGSCGSIGAIALIGVLIAMILLGGVLLKAWNVSDPTSTSFLGVGLVAVITMLFFLEATDSVAMFGVIPVLTGLTFLLSWWVTQTFIEEPHEPDPEDW